MPDPTPAIEPGTFSTPEGRLRSHLLDGESVNFYPHWGADLHEVLAKATAHASLAATLAKAPHSDLCMAFWDNGTDCTCYLSDLPANGITHHEKVGD